MKISTLAAYREVLEDLRSDKVSQAIAGGMDPIIHLISNHVIEMPSILEEIKTTRDQAQQTADKFDQQVQAVLDDLLAKIEGLEPSYFARSYQLYEEMLHNDSVDYILNRRFPIDTETKTYIQSRVQAHSDYHHAGMIIRPGLENWIEHMVACDPLYVVDTNHDLFEPTKSKFNPLYQ